MALMTLTFESRIARILETKIAGAVEQYKETIASGALDNGYYRQCCGHIQGLRSCLEMIGDAEAEANGLEPQPDPPQPPLSIS